MYHIVILFNKFIYTCIFVVEIGTKQLWPKCTKKSAPSLYAVKSSTQHAPYVTSPNNIVYI
jgi:hypothetical protein